MIGGTLAQHGIRWAVSARVLGPQHSTGTPRLSAGWVGVPIGYFYTREEARRYARYLRQNHDH
jgi:hypothetical protein